MWELVKAKLGISLLIALLIGGSYLMGRAQEATKQEKIKLNEQVLAQQQYNAVIAAKTAHNNEVLADKESQIIVLTKKVTIQQEKIRHDKKTIDAQSRISANWLQYTESSSVSNTRNPSANESSGTGFPDTGGVLEASGVLDYIVALHAAQESCAINKNALIKMLD